MQQETIQGFRLSPQQKRLWLLQRERNAGYRAQCALLLEGPLDIELLRQSSLKLVERHETLRTTFKHVPGIKLPVQVINQIETLMWHQLDLREDEAEAEIERLLREARHAAFDFERGPLARFTLLRLSSVKHVLLITLSSLCADEISLQNIFKEISLGYHGRLHEGDLAAETIQYVQFSEWQNDLLESEDEVVGKEFWRDRDTGTPPSIRLPLESDAAESALFEPECLTTYMSSNLIAKIKDRVLNHDVSLSVLLLAGWQSLLWRLTGQSDIVVNFHCDGRVYEDMQGAMGLYARWLPIPHRFSDEEPFSAALDQINRYVEDVCGWQEYFSWEDDSSRNGKQPAGAPDAAVSFAFDEWPTAYEEGGLRFSVIKRHVCTDPFKLKLCVVDAGDTFALEFHYDAAFYDRAAVERLAGEFLRLMESALSEIDGPISGFDILDGAERDLLLSGWNDTATDSARDHCLHVLFEQQAERTPDATALVFGAGRLSFGELNRRANQLSHYLRKQGVGPESRVMLLMERSAEMIVGVLAALKSGAAYMPLDPAQPRSRLAFMLKDAQARVLLTQQSLSSSLPEYDGIVVLIDSDAGLIAQEPHDNPRAPIAPGNLAYVIYTSGSTGKPKGVMIEHHSVVNLLHALRARVYSETNTPLRVSVNAPLAFDSSVKQVYQLLLGQAIYILPEELRRDGEALLSFLEDEALDVLDCTPSQLRMLLEAGFGEGSKKSPSLSLVGGEPIDEALWKRLAQKGATIFHNVYGPTECTVDATTCRVSLEAEQPTIGRPVDNTQLYILDRYLNPVPIGVSGELHIGGAGLSRGYLERPDITAEKFIPNPFGESAGSRLYKTGDLARYLGDGQVEFLGRVDRQVKIRGSRIELGEVESVIGEHQSVSEVVAIAREEADGDKRLVAYVVPVKGDPLSASDLSGFLRERLPEYMVPSAFVLLNQMPLTPNGKVDRKALPAPEIARLESTDACEGARTPVEELLIAIFSGVLGIERIGIRDSFFDLGGHSLLATQITSRIRQAFRVEVPLRSVFETPTVEELAAEIEAAMHSRLGRELPPLRRFSREEPLPLSFAQQRLWFLDQLEGKTSAYNIPAALRLRGALDIEALKNALGEIVRRHEVLRTTFSMRDGRPVQIINPAYQPELPVLDLGTFSDDERAAHAERLLAEELQQPFDLSNGPLVRATLLRLGEEDHVLALSLHHIVFDAWSVAVLYREMVALYEMFAHGRELNLPELPVQYADYASWQREWLRGEVLQDELSYWKEQLEDIAPLDLPTDNPRPAIQTFRGAHQSFTLPDPLVVALKKLSRDEGVTLFMMVLAAFQTLLSRYSGQKDISIGTPVANRNHGEVEGLVGFFLNTLVMRTSTAGDPSFREFLGRVREVALGAYAHQNLPFEKLVEELQPERSLNQTPFFQVMIALRTVAQEVISLSELIIEPMPTENDVAKFDLLLLADETERSIKLNFEYNTDLFEEATIGRMAEHFVNLLESIVADPEQSLSDLSILSELERRQLLIEWNSTAADYPQHESLHQLFEAQVERTPDRIALVSGEQRLSYRELNSRANRLAWHLKALGVGPEALVAICTERNLDMVIGLLAILKAGGAYLPLDPAYPAQRLEYMLDDARAHLLLSVSSVVGSIPSNNIPVICLDSYRDSLPAESDGNPPLANALNLAYTLYTSGSTGSPKGVAIQHKSAVALCGWAVEVFGKDKLDGVLAATSLCFDLSIFELFAPIACGGKVILSENALQLGELPARGEVSLINSVPSVVSELIRLTDLPESVRIVNLAGEPLQSNLVRNLYRRESIREVFNLYGPSEDTTYSTYTMIESGDERPPSIGRPIHETCVYITDDKLQPVPPGVKGEIYIAGRGLARGYLNRPGMTAERFIPDPFCDIAGGRLYKTGDVGRYRADGSIEFLGRKDHQVKIRGFRIELSEIEAVLANYSGLRESVVLAREDVPGNKLLVAYVVSDQPQASVASELSRFLQQKLPAYMIPAAFVFLDALPLTPNGKVNRRALPAPDHSRPALERPYAAPRTALEEVLAQIWCEVLDLERVGIDDNFFELGGHSLLATQLVSRLREDFQINLSLRSLFESPTVATLAERMGSETMPWEELETIAIALKELSYMSDEEAAALLSQE